MGLCQLRDTAGTRRVPRSRRVSLVRTRVTPGSPSAAIPAPAQGEPGTRCPHGAVPALNNSWHCWPQASCPEEEEWQRRGRKSERENHRDLGTSSVRCHLLPGCPSAPDWGMGVPRSLPGAPPCHCPKWGHGAEPVGLGTPGTPHRRTPVTQPRKNHLYWGDLKKSGERKFGRESHKEGEGLSSLPSPCRGPRAPSGEGTEKEARAGRGRSRTPARHRSPDPQQLPFPSMGKRRHGRRQSWAQLRVPSCPAVGPARLGVRRAAGVSAEPGARG